MTACLRYKMLQHSCLKISLRIVIMFILLLMIYGTGCSKKSETDQITLRFVTWKPNQPQVWNEIITIFEKENPDIRLLRETGPHSSTAFHDLLTQKLKSKSKDVDVFFMDVIWPSEFGAAGWAMPLDTLFVQTEREKFLEGTILANTYQDEIFGVPLFIDSGMLFYRKDLLQKYGFKAPKTWREMVEQAEKIVAEEKKLGEEIFGFSGQFKQYEGLVCDMMEFILSNNGEIISQDTGKTSIVDTPALDAVKFVRDNIIGTIAPTGVLTYQETESLDLFIQGKAVFLRSWPYAWEVSNNRERSRIVGRVGIAKLPHFTGGKSYATLGGWQLGINRYSENKEPAWRFLQFMTGERIQKLLAIHAGKAPTRITLYSDPEVLKANPHFSDMKDVFLSAHPRPRSPLYPSISHVLQRYFSRAIANPDSNIEEEAKEAAKEIDRIIALTK